MFFIFTMECENGMRIKMEQEYRVLKRVCECLRLLELVLPIEVMEGHIRVRYEWMEASDPFYDYRDSDGFKRIYEAYRRSIHSAMRERFTFSLTIRLAPIRPQRSRRAWSRRASPCTHGSAE